MNCRSSKHGRSQRFQAWRERWGFLETFATLMTHEGHYGWTIAMAKFTLGLTAVSLAAALLLQTLPHQAIRRAVARVVFDRGRRKAIRRVRGRPFPHENTVLMMRSGLQPKIHGMSER